MSFGAPFPGPAEARAIFQSATSASVTGTFTVPSVMRLVVMVAVWQDSASAASVSAIIGGHAATLVSNSLLTTANVAAIFAAVVSPGDINTWSISNTNVNASRIVVYIYEIENASLLNATATASSNATNPTSTISVLSGSAVIAGAKGQSGGSITPVWTGLTADSTTSGGQAYSAAHLDFAVADAAFTSTCGLTGSAASCGAWAAFSP